MIKDNLVLIFWITFLGFSILALQRLYIHSNYVSAIQLLFVGLYLLFISNTNIFYFPSVDLLHNNHFSFINRCSICQTTVTLSRFMDCSDQCMFMCLFLDHIDSILYLSIPRNNMEIIPIKKNELKISI
jgi:hypothetical protein